MENKKIFGDRKLKPCKKEENICNGIIKVMMNKQSVSKPKKIDGSFSNKNSPLVVGHIIHPTISP